MRPRVFPAEDERLAILHLGLVGASMRPRVFPAEDVTGDVAGVEGRHASMRPRVFPAEDTCSACWTMPPCSSFNEAAGIPRGRRRATAWRRWRALVRFNEAAGIPRGRHWPVGQAKPTLKPLQ